MALTTIHEESLRQSIQNLGLQSFEDEIVKHSYSTYGLMGKEQLEPPQIGTTKFAGSPDIPDSFDRQKLKSLVFVFQVNFAQLQPLDECLGLPSAGLLSVFADSDGVDGVTFYFPEQELIRHPTKPNEESLFSEMTPWTLDVEMGVEIPQYCFSLLDEIEDAGLADAYERLITESRGFLRDQCFAQLLGRHGDLCGHMREMAVDEHQGNVEDWQSLWQINTCAKSGLTIGDMHDLYCLIKTADLKARNFDKLFSIID